MKNFIIGSLETSAGSIGKIATAWDFRDVLNTVRVRWAIGRMSYTVDPGLYAVGNPDAGSPVFVTANFKLTFDIVRRSLDGINGWLLVLDTRGINVWCAAGKGTFGTAELVKRITLHQLGSVVNHRRVIVPQLGATGVSAHEVKEQTGFSVTYGPVRIQDLPEFLNKGMKATEAMREVTFPLWERMKLVPVELSYGGYYLLLIPALFILLAGLNRHGYSIDKAFGDGLRSTLMLLSAYMSGLVITPILLPWIPFRRFALKGLVIGWAVTTMLLFTGVPGTNMIEVISWFLMCGGLSSFLAMNFTGSSTFTSLSGVQKEMKTAVPVQIAMAALGFILWVVSNFITL